MSQTVKYVLEENRIPKSWYNIMADLPSPPPAVLHPGTLQPIFPMSLILQEVATEREIEIPEPVRDVYRQWRPSPLWRWLSPDCHPFRLGYATRPAWHLLVNAPVHDATESLHGVMHFGE